MRGGTNLNTTKDYQIFTNSKELPIEYLILNYRMSLNKDLYENKIINYDVFKRMQKLLITKMNKIIINKDNKT